MRVRWLVAAGLLTMSAAGCGSAIKAASDFDKRIDFANYGTFFMVKGNSTGDSIVDERIASDVGNALESKGWAEVPEGEGKAVVIVHTATGAEHTYGSFYNGWGGWQWVPFDEPAPFPEDYKAGTVVVTIFDADTKRAIWRGFVTDAIADDMKQTTTKVREQAVAKIFAKFPPAQ
jgi:uncharacterized protein DUF4136